MYWAPSSAKSLGCRGDGRWCYRWGCDGVLLGIRVALEVGDVVGTLETSELSSVVDALVELRLGADAVSKVGFGVGAFVGRVTGHVAQRRKKVRSIAENSKITISIKVEIQSFSPRTLYHSTVKHFLRRKTFSF